MVDIEIAQNCKGEDIVKIAKKIGLGKKNLILFGDRKAKIVFNNQASHSGKLILVTSINPTASGNGKTTVSIGLADAFSLKKKKVCLALREPSLGPVFGIKGGATGGGYSQVIPMDDINLHFNGDFHAITSANNLLCAIMDNHIFQGNEQNIDISKILFNRCMDMNDRALRKVTVSDGLRSEIFNITAASEIMAIMCLASDIDDLKFRLGNIIVAMDTNNRPIYAKDLKAVDAMAILLKDALKPNLVQTLIGTPAIIHMGPFANIAHGCNSVIATKTALALADYCITEAGFGADLGAEKFFDLKCRVAGLKPNCVVLVATINALKLNGGADKNELRAPNLECVKAGICNLQAHINFLTRVFGVNLVVTINKFATDTDAELEYVRDYVQKMGHEVVVNDAWRLGGKGCLELCDKVMQKCSETLEKFKFAYSLTDDIKTKIQKVAQNIYGAGKVEYSAKAEESIELIQKLKLDHLPIINAKTQYSLSDNQRVFGAPKDFVVTVRDVELRAGAGFLVVLLGNMTLMPGLSKTPAAINMSIDNNEKIKGLF